MVEVEVAAILLSLCCGRHNMGSRAVHSTASPILVEELVLAEAQAAERPAVASAVHQVYGEVLC